MWYFKTRRYQSAKELEDKIEEYFKDREEDDITITGLCLHLGIHKDTFYEYAKLPQFKDIIDMARLRVENSYEIGLKKHGGSANIFALKNFGWSDNKNITINADDENKKLMEQYLENMKNGESEEK